MAYLKAICKVSNCDKLSHRADCLFFRVSCHRRKASGDNVGVPFTATMGRPSLAAQRRAVLLLMPPSAAQMSFHPTMIATWGLFSAISRSPSRSTKSIWTTGSLISRARSNKSVNRAASAQGRAVFSSASMTANLCLAASRTLSGMGGGAKVGGFLCATGGAPTPPPTAGLRSTG